MLIEEPPKGLSFAERAAAPTRAVRERLSALGLPPVPHSKDLERVLALPRRAIPSLVEQQSAADFLTDALKKPEGPCDCASRGRPCIKRLLPVQGWYLLEASRVGGALGHIVVGGGKTGIDILLPMVVRCKRAALLIPPALRAQFAADFHHWSQHFHVPNLVGGAGPFRTGVPVLEVVSYSELSSKGFAAWFQATKPDCVIADEAQALKDKKAARTLRFIQHFIKAPNTKFFCHSGSLTTRSVEDFAHLSALALRDGSPVPLDSGQVIAWGAALDPEKVVGGRAPAGALNRLCQDGEPVRQGFRRRLLETPGVISTVDAQLAIPLYIRERKPPPMPLAVKDALDLVRRTEARPDGQELVEETEVAACLKQVACGFFYRWKFPRGEPSALIEEWFSRRKAYFSEVRRLLEHPRTFLDSPGYAMDAAKRALAGYKGPLPVWHSRHFAAWQEIQKEVQPVSEAVWVSDWLARDAVEWAKNSPGIIWCLHTAFARRVAELGRLPYFGGGDLASLEIAKETGARSIVASIKAHGTGKNLQAFSRNLVANSPSDGGAWEQLLGRTHRLGQTAESVSVDVYRHTPEVARALEDARGFARYRKEVTGAIDRLELACYCFT